ncbi:hypothetical protein LLE49_06895 [Alicyclobacillus tolerans]|uniref:hypothetical protein n=1 Tax=Alicyclobacillus tolerans TaxID=90970 RepID=UPI001F19336D|nr:hypothetical protein [Alicyclobacillus tolerans]MCF8564473.1 hypothetical protein [Alicyclobacillus tolerans]
MFKKVNFSSPLGIALTVATVVLALSPEARRSLRRWMVKGTAGVMDTAGQIGAATSGMFKQTPGQLTSGAEPLSSEPVESAVDALHSANVLEPDASHDAAVNRGDAKLQ